MDWQSRVDDLCYDGESVRERVDAGSNHVAVTTHRVLVFTPDAGGAAFRAVDRPNVAGVEAKPRGNVLRLRQAVVAAVAGFVFFTAGTKLNFDVVVPESGVDVAAVVGGGNVTGLRGYFETINTLVEAVALLDELFVILGPLLLLLGVVLVGVYLYGQELTLSISVVGGDDVHLPWPTDVDGADSGDESTALDRATVAADRIERTVFTTQTAAAAADAAEQTDPSSAAEQLPEKPEPDELEFEMAEPDEPESDEPEPDEPESDEPEPDEPESDEPEPDEPEPDEPEPDEPEPDEP